MSYSIAPRPSVLVLKAPRVRRECDGCHRLIAAETVRVFTLPEVRWYCRPCAAQRYYV
jgi:RNase P subunit RPR2